MSSLQIANENDSMLFPMFEFVPVFLWSSPKLAAFGQPYAHRLPFWFLSSAHEARTKSLIMRLPTELNPQRSNLSNGNKWVG